MRVTLATPRFFPDGFGGVETYTAALAGALQQLGHDVRVICTRTSSGAGAEIRLSDDLVANIPVRRILLDPDSRASSATFRMFDPAVAKVVGETLRTSGAEVLHVTNFAGISAAIVPVARSLGIPTVWMASDFGLTCSRFILVKWDRSLCHGKASFRECLDCLRPRSGKSELLFPILRQLKMASDVHQRMEELLPRLDEIDLIMAPSSWMKEVLVMNGADPGRIFVSAHGLDTTGLHRSIRQPRTPVRFVFVGRINWMKGVHLLVDAFNSLARPNGAILTIYGSPDEDQQEYGSAVQADASRNPNIRLAPPVSRETLGAALADADVFVAPSTWSENTPIAILEAQHQGLPVIASRVQGVQDLLEHGRNSLLFETGDVADLKRQIQGIIDNPNLIEQLSRATHVAEDISTHASMLVGHYQRLTANPESGGASQAS
jgi:glycosyltransferase involved in cell wall biosynthesis